jgi:hypothetical protein
MTRAILLPVVALALIACTSDETQPPTPSTGAGGGPPDCGLSGLLIDDGCVPIGVPPDGCGEGFESDELGGCAAQIPADPCPAGTMAVPGEVSCREVAPCGDGTWGDIVTDNNTQFVDANFTGMTSDGTQLLPWVDIPRALAAAAAGATIAVAEGRYSDALVINKPVTIWGRCPSLVEITAPNGIGVSVAEPGTVIRAISITSSTNGLSVLQASDLLIDSVWIRSTGAVALAVQDTSGPSVVMVIDSLIEGARDLGVIVAGSTLTMDRSVVRDTEPRPSDGAFGGAIEVLPGFDSGAPAQLHLRRAVLERNHDVALAVNSAQATIEDTLIRYTLPASSQKFGRALNVESNPLFQQRASVEVRRSVFHDQRDTGVFVAGADLVLQNTVVSSTVFDLSDSLYGRIVQVQDRPENGHHGSATISSCLLAGGYDAGLVVLNSDAVVDRTWVRDVLSRDADQLFGDGIAVIRNNPQQDFAGEPMATLSMGAVRVERSARAGISNFGGAISVGNTAIECNTIDISGEPDEGVEPVFDDLGANSCRCDGDTRECRSLSTGLAPPEPLPD